MDLPFRFQYAKARFSEVQRTLFTALIIAFFNFILPADFWCGGVAVWLWRTSFAFCMGQIFRWLELSVWNGSFSICLVKAWCALGVNPIFPSIEFSKTTLVGGLVRNRFICLGWGM